MIFTPYNDEQKQIDIIQKYLSCDYSLIRITSTMIEKNNPDANIIFRDVYENINMVKYDTLEPGGENGVEQPALLIFDNEVMEESIKFYIVNNTRGDKRFSINRIKDKWRKGFIREGDLVYFSYNKNDVGRSMIVMFNLTRNVPNEELLYALFGLDKIYNVLEELTQKVRAISQEGFHDNSVGTGPIQPKDVGDTLEFLLGIETNNSPLADYDGIEIKSKVGQTKDTLFTLRPRFEGTHIADYETKDRSRVSAFTRVYGYMSEKHPNAMSLYITIGSEEAPQNRQGFYLDISEDERKINICGRSPVNGKVEVTAYWTFDDLRETLDEKHRATLWVSAEHRMSGEIAQFKYTDAVFTKQPNFTTFLMLVKAGAITYDWRGYTSISGKYSGKNHGNAWRIKKNYRESLFGETDIIYLDEQL